jgi:hypothetical protein
MVKAVQLSGRGEVVDQAEINRNLALFDEVLLRLVALIPPEQIVLRVQKILQVEQEHDDLISGKGVNF